MCRASISKLRGELNRSHLGEGILADCHANRGVFRSMLTCSAAAPKPLTESQRKYQSSRDSPDNNLASGLGITSATDQPPIEIPCPSLILRLFVDLIHHAPLLSDPRDHPSCKPTRCVRPSSGELLTGSPTATSTNLSPSSIDNTTNNSPDLPSAHFADLFRPANAPLRGRPNSVKRLLHLLDLLDQFECGAGLQERALTHFEPYFPVDPWSVFCVAGKYDDLVLARKAIRCFGTVEPGHQGGKLGESLDPRLMGVAQADRVPPGWLMGYWRAYTDAKQHERTVSGWPSRK